MYRTPVEKRQVRFVLVIKLTSSISALSSSMAGVRTRYNLVSYYAGTEGTATSTERRPKCTPNIGFGLRLNGAHVYRTCNRLALLQDAHEFSLSSMSDSDISLFILYVTAGEGVREGISHRESRVSIPSLSVTQSRSRRSFPISPTAPNLFLQILSDIQRTTIFTTG